MSDPEIRALTPQPSAAVRLSRPTAELDLAVLFGEHLPNIAHRLADLGIEPAGPPYGRYTLHDWIHAEGREERPGPWESYVDDPGEVAEADLRTEVCWPLS